jgi:hypothetical protein
MPHRATCPRCGKIQTVAEGDAGQSILCCACGARFNDTPVSTLPPSPSPALGPLVPVSTTPPPLLTPSHVWIYFSAAVSLFSILLISFIVLERANQPGTQPPAIILPSITYPSTHPATSQIATAPPTTQAEIPPIAVSSQPLVPATAPAPSVAIEAPVPSPIAPVAPTTMQTSKAPQPRIHPVAGAVSVDNLDDQIGQAIGRGVSFLIAGFKDGRLMLSRENPEERRSGLDALAVYALLHAGEATADPRLGPHSPLVDQMLTTLKKLPMEHGPATYSRALRAAALSVYNRPEDRQTLQADAAWMRRAGNNGAYTYEILPPNRRSNFFWDNSNSQYGALGVWVAEEAGVEVPLSYWEKVEQHWLACQLPHGEWAYSPGSNEGRLSMTVAGITTLFVTQDQLVSSRWSAEPGRAPFSPALTRGLKWLETNDNAVTLPMDNVSYNLYGLERAALASGFKYFGTHDWYRELASRTLPLQSMDGSWSGENDVVDTSFTLLFLSRGRHPIFMNKLRFDGFWANRPRDISNLCRYASTETERPLNWQVVSLATGWNDWMDSPVLFISSHQAIKFQNEDYDKLRAFAENGGLIFTHSDGASEPFNHFVADLGRHLFPDDLLQDLPSDHEIYSTLFKIDPKPKLQGISNGSRLLLLHSPTDLSKPWQLRDSKLYPASFQMGVNIFIYAAGKANLRNKLKTPYVPESKVTPIATVPVARLRYIGNWNPEPAGWTRFSRQFQNETSIELAPATINLRELKADAFPLAHLTGTNEVRFNDDQVKAVHDYVASGGVLLIDSCGGSTPFTQSIRGDLLQRAFPNTNLVTLPADHPILAGAGEGMTPVMMKLRPRESEILGTATEPLEYLQERRGLLLFSNLDLSSALLGTNTYSIAGYDPDSAHSLIRNAVLWTIERK